MSELNPIIQRKLDAIARIGRKELTVGEAQAILGYASPAPIVSDRGIISKHQVIAAKIGGQWLIDSESFKHFILQSTSVLPL